MSATRLATLLAALALIKPHIALLALVSGAWGAVLAPGSLELRDLFSLLGLGLLVAGANALNMVLEVEPDRQMVRTRSRPLPAGQLRRASAAALGVGAASAGLLALGLLASIAAMLLGLAALALYLGAYTPLKKISPVALIPGALAGATPVLIGWQISAGALQAEVLYPFGILLCWQLPHFAAIALLWREDYARGGFCTLPQVLGRGGTARLMVLSCALLLGVSVLPSLGGFVGATYSWCALLLGGALLAASVLALLRRSWLLRLYRGTLIYLPALALCLALGRWQP